MKVWVVVEEAQESDYGGFTSQVLGVYGSKSEAIAAADGPWPSGWVKRRYAVEGEVA